MAKSSKKNDTHEEVTHTLESQMRESSEEMHQAAQRLERRSNEVSNVLWQFRVLPMVLFFTVVGAMLYVGSENATTLLDRLADPAVARGLITLLFSVGTIWVIIQLAAYAISYSSSDEQFQRGKDVLTVLVGIFGTIIGFYFGAEYGTVKKPSDSTQINGSSGVPNGGVVAPGGGGAGTPGGGAGTPGGASAPGGGGGAPDGGAGSPEM